MKNAARRALPGTATFILHRPIPAKEKDLRSLLADGLQHEDRFVRQYCLRYWKDQPERSEAQARRVITALETYGIQAFP